MTLIITGGGEKTTLEWSRLENSQVLIDLTEAASHYLWDLGRGNHGTSEEPISFDQLDQSQKLEFLGEHIEQVLFDLAKSYDVNFHVEVKRAEREEIAKTKYAIGDKAVIDEEITPDTPKESEITNEG